jgi:PPOX class probable F420-dependent enzyme
LVAGDPADDGAEVRARFARAPVARLATVRVDGSPHIVPVCFALAPESETAVSIVDDKPKRTTALRRLDNVRAHAAVSLLVDHYDDDWTRLWWVRVDGSATVVEGGPEHERAVAWLADKYHQYRERVPTGPVLRIAIERWRAWSGA